MPSPIWGGLPNKDTITISCITDCPSITIHAGKCYKALIDSGAPISLLRYSTYKKIEDCYKTPIQPTTAKLNTTDGSPMTALESTTLHLQIAEFKFMHNFIICNQLPKTELIFSYRYSEEVFLILCLGQGQELLYAKEWQISSLNTLR